MVFKARKFLFRIFFWTTILTPFYKICYHPAALEPVTLRYCLISPSGPTRRHKASICAIYFDLDTSCGAGGHFVISTAVSVVVFPLSLLSNKEVLLLSCQFSDLSLLREFLSIIFAVYCDVLCFSKLHFVIYSINNFISGFVIIR